MTKKSTAGTPGKPNDGADSKLLVMGARGSNRTIGTFHSRSWRLVSLNAETLMPMVSTWQYEGEGRHLSGTDFFDTQPNKRLIVSAGGESTTLKSLNLIGNFPALCALRDDGRLHAWGWDEYGGNPPEEIKQIKNAVQIEGSMAAFVVRRATGNVMAWGSPRNPSSQVPADIAALTNIVDVVGGTDVFVALLSTGQVVAWGREDTGGKLPEEIAALTDIVYVIANQFACAALRRNGQVVAWGDPDNGGDVPQEIKAFTDVVQIATSGRNFAVRRANGKIAIWGGKTLPPIPSDIAELDDIVDIVGRADAFAVRRDNGQVKGWGFMKEDFPPKDITELTNIVHVTATSYSFIALLATGHVVAWGFGMAAIIPPEIAKLSDIVSISTNHEAAVVLRSNGEAIGFGDPDIGGDSSQVSHLLKNVRAVYSGTNTFCALTQDSRVVAWGEEQKGGTGEQKALYGLISYAEKSVP